jgi:hypothetical protein
MQPIMSARLTRFAAAGLLVLTLGTACANETKTVKQETFQYPAASGENTATPAVERQTTETTTETKKESGGVISSGVNFFGRVISFPFQVFGVAFGELY